MFIESIDRTDDLINLCKPPTVFGLGEDGAVLRAVVQNHARSKKVWAAL